MKSPSIPEIVYYVATSLDGYIATNDGRVDWLERFGSADEDHGAGALYSSVVQLIYESGPTRRKQRSR